MRTGGSIGTTRSRRLYTVLISFTRSSILPWSSSVRYCNLLEPGVERPASCPSRCCQAFCCSDSRSFCVSSMTMSICCCHDGAGGDRRDCCELMDVALVPGLALLFRGAAAAAAAPALREGGPRGRGAPDMMIKGRVWYISFTNPTQCD